MKKLRLFLSFFSLFFTSSPFANDQTFQEGYRAFLSNNSSQAVQKLSQHPLSNNHLLYDYQQFALGKSNFKLNKNEEALKAFQELIQKDPKSIWASSAKVSMAEIYLQNRQLKEAKELLEKSESTIAKEQRGELLYFLGLAELQSGEKEKALSHWKEAYENYPASTTDDDLIRQTSSLSSEEKIVFSPSSQATLKRMEKLFELKKWSRLLEISSPFLSHPDLSLRSVAQFRRGLALLNLKRNAEAVSLLSSLDLQTLDSVQRSEALFNLANAYLKTGNSSLALSTFSQVIQQGERNDRAEEALFKIGKTQLDQGENEKGIQTFRQLAEKYPNGKFRDQALWLAGWTLYRQSNFDQSFDFLKKMESLASDSPTKGKALYWQGRIFQKKGDEKSAMETFGRTAQLSPFSYYGFMALKQKEKNLELAKVPAILPEWKILKTTKGILKADKTAWSDRPFRKALMLYKLGFGKQSIPEVTEAVQQNDQNLPGLLSLLDQARQSSAGYISVLFSQRQWDRFQKAFPSPEIAEQYRVYLQYPLVFPDEIKQAAAEFGLPPALVAGLIRQESALQPWIVSSADARGLMQLIPETAQRRAKTIGMGGYDLFQPSQNVRLGTAELAALIQRFSGNWIYAIAGYNAGPGRPIQWSQEKTSLDPDEFIEEIPFQETNLYVKLVLRNYWIYSNLYRF